MPQFVETGRDDAGEGMSDYDTAVDAAWPKSLGANALPETPRTEEKAEDIKRGRPALPWTDERKPLKREIEPLAPEMQVSLMCGCLVCKSDVCPSVGIRLPLGMCCAMHSTFQ